MAALTTLSTPPASATTAARLRRSEAFDRDRELRIVSLFLWAI
jgi:hypothetical protein